MPNPRKSPTCKNKQGLIRLVQVGVDSPADSEDGRKTSLRSEPAAPLSENLPKSASLGDKPKQKQRFGCAGSTVTRKVHSLTAHSTRLNIGRTWERVQGLTEIRQEPSEAQGSTAMRTPQPCIATGADRLNGRWALFAQRFLACINTSLDRRLNLDSLLTS